MISVRNLVAGYGSRAVVKSIGLSVEKGEFAGVLGPNACGKSTLVKVLSGVLPPMEGEMEVAGLVPHSAPPAEVARRVAVVPQGGGAVFPFTGREVVEMGRFVHAGRFSALSEADGTAIHDALAKTGALELADRLVTELSGGERQRVFLARALAQEAPLLLLDEATASMDVHRSMDAFDLLAGVNKRGTTILAVLHDLNLAALYCKRLIFIKDGRVEADGPTEEVFTAKTLREVYETGVDVAIHPATGKPHAVFLPGHVDFMR